MNRKSLKKHVHFIKCFVYSMPIIPLIVILSTLGRLLSKPFLFKVLKQLVLLSLWFSKPGRCRLYQQSFPHLSWAIYVTSHKKTELRHRGWINCMMLCVSAVGLLTCEPEVHAIQNHGQQQKDQNHWKELGNLGLVEFSWEMGNL